jgi:hypothetical protein
VVLRWLTRSAVAWLLLGVNAAVAQKCWSPEMASFYDREVQSREYKSWLEVDHIARMPDAQRAVQIPHVYRDIFADLYKRFYALDNWMVVAVGPLDGYEKSRTPEEQMKVGMQPGYPNMFAQRISLMLFDAYPHQTEPLILQDLRSSDPGTISRGLRVSGGMQESVLPGLFDDLQRISFSDGQCSDEALRTLIDYCVRPSAYLLLSNKGKSFTPNSKALGLIPLLVPRFQKEPQRYVGALMELLPYAPAPKELLADLNSWWDTNLRLYALDALSASQDLLPAAYIIKLAGDRNPKMRGWSITLGFQKRRQDFDQLKPALAKLLDDPEWDVRRSAALQFAARQDPICAATLLQLLKDVYRSGQSGDFYQFASEADYIAHQKFGFDPGTGPVPLHNEKNDTALKSYASWVQSRN